MALIKCTNCQKEISDKATVCPQCGTPIEKTSEVNDNKLWKCEECGVENGEDVEVCSNCGCPKPVVETPQKVEIASIAVPKIKVNENTKKYAIIAVIVVIVAIIAVIGFKGSSEKKYLSNLETTSSTMLTGAAEAESACNLIRSVWYNTIHEEFDEETDKYTLDGYWFYDDFNDSLRNLFSDPVFQAELTSIERNQEKVAKLMKELQNPPEKYEEAYQAIKEYYSAYTTLTNLAIDPTGSLQTFTSNFNEADEEVLKCLNAMKMYF